ncbi:hypothetical protein [Nocardia altamirensis]|uniref:hypothetical protein n=1 Tax=Nocardia altamirensis TaxID=472158 RepID=UPI0014355510|nr:hypothetical protein [Nocardia altamirensis]
MTGAAVLAIVLASAIGVALVMRRMQQSRQLRVLRLRAGWRPEHPTVADLMILREQEIETDGNDDLAWKPQLLSSSHSVRRRARKPAPTSNRFWPCREELQ